MHLVVAMGRLLLIVVLVTCCARPGAEPLASGLRRSTYHQTSFRELLSGVRGLLAGRYVEPVTISATEADGRSLQSRFDTLAFKRKSVAFTLGSEIPLLFLGFAPKAKSAEWISWDPAIRRYVPQVSHGVAPHSRENLRVEAVTAQACNVCHQVPHNDPRAGESVSLIFPSFPWFEQTNDPTEAANIMSALREDPVLFEYSNLNQVEKDNVQTFVMGPTIKKEVDNKGRVTLTSAVEFDGHIRKAQVIQRNARMCEQICDGDEECLKNFLAYLILQNTDFSRERSQLLNLLSQTSLRLSGSLKWDMGKFSYPSGVLSNYNPFPSSRDNSTLPYGYGVTLMYDEIRTAISFTNNNQFFSKASEPPHILGIENSVNANGYSIFNTNSPLSPRALQPGVTPEQILRAARMTNLIKTGHQNYLADPENLVFSCFSVTRKEIIQILSRSGSITNIVEGVLATDFGGRLDRGWPLSGAYFLDLIRGSLRPQDIPVNEVRSQWKQEGESESVVEKEVRVGSKQDFVNVLVEKCAGCHASSAALTMGNPELPFDATKTAEQVFSDLKTYRTRSGRSILDRIKAKEMPPPTSSEAGSLSANRRRVLVDFLQAN